MFEQMKAMGSQMQMMQKLMQNEHFRAFIAHPKVQELFKDEAFKDIAKLRDFSKIVAEPKFAALMRDPEVAALMAKLNLKELMNS